LLPTGEGNRGLAKEEKIKMSPNYAESDEKFAIKRRLLIRKSGAGAL